MFKKLLAFTCLTLSLGVNAASVDYIISVNSGDLIAGSFSFDAVTDAYSNVAIDTPYGLYISGLATSYGAVFDQSELVPTLNGTRVLEPGGGGGGGGVITAPIIPPGIKHLDFYFIPDLSSTNPTTLNWAECASFCDPNGSQPYHEGIIVVTPSAVPLPAAVWLFGSALVGLVGIGRRKKA